MSCGELYTWGSPPTSPPTPPSVPAPLTDVRGTQLTNICGGYGSLAVIQPNHVTFPLLSTRHAVPQAALNSDTDPVTAIAFGKTHALALTTSGTLLSWGSSKYGALGAGASISASQVSRAALRRSALR